MSDEILERIVPSDAPKDRLDRAVSRLFGVSRGRAMEWITDDRVRVDGRRAPKGAQVGPGARVCVRRPPPDSPVQARRVLSVSGSDSKKSRERMLFQVCNPITLMSQSCSFGARKNLLCGPNCVMSLKPTMS